MAPLDILCNFVLQMLGISISAFLTFFPVHLAHVLVLNMSKSDLLSRCMPGVGLMVSVVALGSEGPKFKSCSPVELTPDGVDSACHPSKVGKMSTSLLG